MNILNKFIVLIFLIGSFVNAHAQNGFVNEVDFDFTYGVPIIEVNINNQTYRFLYDTGMPTAISKEIYDRFNLKYLKEEKIGFDVNGNSEQQKYSEINNLFIENISFGKSSVLVVDFTKHYELKCLKIDGVFGNNLIQKYFWKIDYKNYKLTFTDNLELLNIPKNSNSINFKLVKNDFSPLISLKLNEKKIRGITFDTGSNRSLGCNLYNFKKIKPKNNIKLYGTSSMGLYGRGNNNVYYKSLINKIEFGNTQILNYIVEFKPNSFSVLGNDFLKDYIVFIDYKNQKINFKKEKSEKKGFTSFGFLPKVQKGVLKVSSIIESSIAEKKGLKINSEILELNGIIAEKIITDCHLLKEIFKADIINIKFRTDKKTKQIKLFKKDFFN